ncbi:hypothetical protein GNF18_10285 [Ligilactobacillus pobuzihii]|uniref:hypothetical protein n=1 Tax=Ligilactobacillus pobuzihii TaxID=449659 RepID=UPI0019D30D75|nr:hypothetical protein [Ligilactobacillus pobuzihii]MBN7275528.1 hypothetical protein [Ligilactobacillus pobuzihii]
MSRQRKKHPEVVIRRKVGRSTDKLTSKMGYVSSNPRGRRILRLLGVNKKPNNAMPSDFVRAFLEKFIK